MDNEIKGYVHSIETMGLVDGPGNRTIFFLQGCPLKCVYCHNPDSQNIHGGKEYTVDEIIKIAKRYKPYHGQEGGVTISGGEPLLQGEFLKELLKRLKEEGFNTCLDTSGVGEKKYYSEILPYIDTMLLDFKAFDSDLYKKITFMDDKNFLEFVDNLESNGFCGNIWARHVMVPGFTDNYEEMDKFVESLDKIKNMVERIEILPYHLGGVYKYENLGRKYFLENVEAMDKKVAEKFEKYVNAQFAKTVSYSRRDEALNFQARKITEEQFDMEDNKKYLLEAIKDVELFKGIDNVDYDEAIEKMKFLKLKAEDYIFKPGDSAENMYVIHKGTIKVFHNTIDGREQILYLYHENDFVGGHNILEDVEYIYMGQALTDCEVIMIPRDIFNKYLINSPLALTKILKKSFERIRLAEDLVQRLSTSNATMKTAALLLRLKDTMGVETKDGIRLDLAMNREELGNYSGLTRETITRKLGEFKKLGYIDLIGTKVIVIKNVKILEELVL